MYVINAHTRSNRQMHGGIQCISYYGYQPLEQTKEVVLIVPHSLASSEYHGDTCLFQCFNEVQLVK